MSEETLRRVVDLLVDHQCVRRERVRPESRIELDLGITGDDAAELMKAFMDRFGVDMTGFEFPRHFGAEGCFPPMFLMRRLFPAYRDLGRCEEITVGHLVRVAVARRWFDPPPRSRRCGRPRPNPR